MSIQKAYIKTIKLSVGEGYVACVISERDCAASSVTNSHQSKQHPTPEGAKAAATEWAEEHGFHIYSEDDFAGKVVA